MPSYQQTLVAAMFHALAFVTISNAAIDLGSAAAYGALAASSLTSTGLTIVNGDIGVYPGTSITGFPPGVFTGIESDGDPVAETAQSDAANAYQAAIALPCGTDLTGQDLGGQTLAPGVYCFSSSATLTGILTLDAGGNSNAQFVFQIGSALGTATGSEVLLLNGAQSCGVTWAVGSSATLGSGTDFVGDILAAVSITLDSVVTSQGGLYALTGGITLIDDTITVSQATCTVVVTTSTASVTQPVTTSLQTVSSTLSTVLINSSFNYALNELFFDSFFILDTLNELFFDSFFILDTLNELLLDSFPILDALNELLFYSFLILDTHHKGLNPLLNSPYYHNKHPTRHLVAFLIGMEGGFGALLQYT